MKISKTLIFLLLTVSLTTYVYLYEYKGAVTSKNSYENKILQFDIDQINYFQLIKGEGRIAFQKTETGWSLLEPILENADNDKVTELLSSLAQEQIETVVRKTDSSFNETDLAEYGLDRPALTFNFKNNLGTTTKVHVGSIKNFEGQSYVYIDGAKEVWLGSANWFNRSLEKLIDYRDKRIFRENLAQVNEIRITSLEDKIALQRVDGRWKSSAHSFDIDQIMVREILKKISDTQIEEYIFEGEPSLQLLKEKDMSEAPVSIELVTDKMTWTSKLNVSKKEGHLYLLSDKPTYLAHISPLVWEAVSTLTLDGLRDRTTSFIFAAEDVKKIFFKNNGKENNLIFNSGNWLMGPTGGPYINMEKAEVSARIKRIHELKITDFIDEDVKDKFVGDNMLILKNDRDKLLLQLNWGPEFVMTKRGKENTYYYARTQHSTQIFALAKSEIDDLRLLNEDLTAKAGSEPVVEPAPPQTTETSEK